MSDKRWVPAVVLAVLLLGVACGDDGEEAASTTAPASSTSTTGAAVTTTAVTSPTTTSPAPATTTPATTAPATSLSKAATAVIEPDSVGGIGFGSNKTEAYNVLGPPTTTGQETDLSGAKYDFLRWELAGNRGLILNYRTQGVTSPLLTDWAATAPGPVTAKGIKVGDPASAVVAAYGPLGPFCCGVERAEASQGGGRMVVLVEPGGNVRQIIGGDPGFWSRSIAD